jgi:hypothetical protein
MKKGTCRLEKRLPITKSKHVIKSGIGGLLLLYMPAPRFATNGQKHKTHEQKPHEKTFLLFGNPAKNKGTA